MSCEYPDRKNVKQSTVNIKRLIVDLSHLLQGRSKKSFCFTSALVFCNIEKMETPYFLSFCVCFHSFMSIDCIVFSMFELFRASSCFFLILQRSLYNNKIS